MTDTVLYFGSYNPVHKGHTAIAEYVAGAGYGEVWMVVTPHNPFKPQGALAPDADRLRMVEIAAAATKNPAIAACGIEFGLPKPSYTIDTLRALAGMCPERRLRLLVGGDILGQFDRWKEYGAILRDFRVLVYPRPDMDAARFAGQVEILHGAPMLPWSSTGVRERLERGGDCGEMLDPGVYKYIKNKGLWKTK